MSKQRRAAEDDGNDMLVSGSELARLLRRHPETIARWRRQGRLAYVRLPSGRYLYRLSALKVALREVHVPLPAPHPSAPRR